MYASRRLITVATNATYEGWSIAIAPLMDRAYFGRGEDPWPNWTMGIKILLIPNEENRAIVKSLYHALESLVYHNLSFRFEVGEVTICGSHEGDSPDSPFKLTLSNDRNLEYCIDLRNAEVSDLIRSLDDYWKVKYL